MRSVNTHGKQMDINPSADEIKNQLLEASNALIELNKTEEKASIIQIGRKRLKKLNKTAGLI